MNLRHTAMYIYAFASNISLVTSEASNASTTKQIGKTTLIHGMDRVIESYNEIHFNKDVIVN